MDNKRLLSRITDKLLGNQKVRDSYEEAWRIHAAAFGPIINQAFIGNDASRILLVNALNHISRNDLVSGLKLLERLQNKCETDADMAAWNYFMGLVYEKADDKEHMLMYYSKTAEYNHSFYLPYLKAAKSAYDDAVFEIAEEYYKKVLSCLGEKPIEPDEQNNLIIASTYSNLASCLTMMHRYEEAEGMLGQSKKALASLPNREAIYAILYSAMLRKDKVLEALAELEKGNELIGKQTRDITDEILSGRHPHFSIVPPERGLISPFWHWFMDNEEKLRSLIEKEEYDEVINALFQKLQPIFTFMNRDLEFGIYIEKPHYVLELGDFFNVSLEEGYKELLTACPEELKNHWQFTIIH